MQLGIGTYTYGWNIGMKDAMPDPRMNETDLVAAATRFGVGLLQIGDNLPLHTFPADRLAAFAALLRRHNMILELGARGMKPDHLKEYICLCAALNVRMLRFVVDGDDFEPDLYEIEDIIRSQEMLLHEKKVTLALENHDRLKSAELAGIVETIGSERVGVCLDTVNSMGAAEGLETVVKTLAPFTVNLHLKDFTITRSAHKMGFAITGTPAGAGMLNIPWLLDQVKQYGRCHTAILELWTPPEEAFENTLAREKRWASESMEYLKAFFTV